ncbi:MAG: hypothetical protein IJL67_10130 [Oscillospiraceae bacterium]|nr:hypothetical protein [Oscillospiraceae bacterium]
MINSLEELIKNRKELIEVHRKNNFTDGIRTLLTDLYPDTAHFIYELLQNAEDMNAETVRFRLQSDKLYFEHNGTKRAFNLSDIDAITNIGHNAQKKDDPTSIGKFGVGFKAVFSYTSTPIIHSGDYHFRIRDYFVPETDGVTPISVTDDNGVQWTKFEFPFNNQKKTPPRAFEEILTGFKKLNDQAILFLNSIKRIDFSTDDGKSGFLEREIKNEHYLTVKYKKINAQNISSSEWLYFTQPETITDEHKCKKEMYIAAAFALGKSGRNKKTSIVPVEGGGKTFIYFPAEKEYSGLRFHINAPFASTVARDSVRECFDNVKLISKVSKLICKYLNFIKREGLLDVSFLSVLPNNNDGLSEFYSVIVNDIIDTFRKNKLIPSLNGEWLSYNESITGPEAVSELFGDEVLLYLTDEKKKWIINSFSKNSNADYFIRSLDIQSYSYENLIIDIGNNKHNIEWKLGDADNNWLSSFYLLCADMLNNSGINTFKRIQFNQNLQELKLIRTTRGLMMKPDEVLILPPNSGVSTRSLNIVSDKFLKESGKNSQHADKIRNFFMKKLNIREYSVKVEIEKILEKYKYSRKIRKNSSEYFGDLLTLAEYSNDSSETNFSDYFIFLYEDEVGGLYTDKPESIIIGKHYGNNAGELIAGAAGIHCLWSGYRKIYDPEEMKLILDFAENTGVVRGLSIISSSVKDNPQYRTSLHGIDVQNKYGVDIDYTIKNLDKIVKIRSKKVSLLLWECIFRNNQANSVDYTMAVYRANKNSEAKSCDSSLVYYLKNFSWIPDKNGRFHKPSDISYDQISDEFVITSPDNNVFKALDIGSTASSKKEKKLQLEKDAAKAGMALIPDSEYNDYMQWKKLQKQKKAKEAVSMHELLEKNNRTASSDSKDDFTGDGSVRNVNKRSDKLEEKFNGSLNSESAAIRLFAKPKISSEDEKRTLRNWYNGECQFCGTSIMKSNGDPYFIAKNIVSTKNFSSEVQETMSIAWNSLCLCPNCAAKYDVCTRNMSGVYEQILSQTVIEGDVEDIVVSFELDGNVQDIKFCAKHFLALQVGIRCFERLVNDEDR